MPCVCQTQIYRMREVSCVGAFAESFRSSCAREQQQQKQQPAFCRCLRTAVGSRVPSGRVSAVASCLARFVFRGVRQQQQHVLASLLARSRVVQPTPQPASTSVWQGRLSVGAVSAGSELSNSLAIAAYQKCQSAIIGLLSRSLSPALARSPWTLPLSSFVAPLAKSVLHVIYSYYGFNSCIHYTWVCVCLCLCVCVCAHTYDYYSYHMLRSTVAN